MGMSGSWKWMGFIVGLFTILLCIIHVSVYVYHFQNVLTQVNLTACQSTLEPLVYRPKRDVSPIPVKPNNGPLVIPYVKGSSSLYKFDLCDMIDCENNPLKWKDHEVYLCEYTLLFEDWCASWDRVIKYTGAWKPLQGKEHPWTKVTFTREFSVSSDSLLFSMTGFTAGDAPRLIGIYDDRYSWFPLILGVEMPGMDLRSMINVTLIDPPVTTPAPAHDIVGLTEDTRVKVVDYTKLTPQEAIELATGYGQGNMWLDWLVSTAEDQHMQGCVACASARPHLYTEPAPLYPNDTWGYNCMIGLTKEATPRDCSTLASIFPPIDNETKPAPFQAVRGNNSFMCYTFNSTYRGSMSLKPSVLLGSIDSSWCTETRDGSDIGSWARSGLYYDCGGRRLTVRIPYKSDGICAMVRLATPVLLLGDRVTALKTPVTAATLTRRRRRHVIHKRDFVDDFNRRGNPTYIDAIGIPRGVPNEYKLVDQVAAGFENIPIISALFPVTPSKNVDRINYIHYNVLRLTNLTHDAVEGLAEQLGPTSLMAVQNRMALDMVLAEKGGVCAMFGDMCCTFIPNNTAPDGSVVRALEGLRALSKTMHEHSGLENPLDEWFTKMFGKWKGVMISILMSGATFLAILVTCGCCCIPCIRSLCNRIIVRSIEGGIKGAPPPYMMPLLASEPDTGDQVELLEVLRDSDL